MLMQTPIAIAHGNSLVLTSMCWSWPYDSDRGAVHGISNP